MTEPTLRDSYLIWTRRALPALLLPLALTAILQAGASSDWWSAGPDADGGARYLFIAVGVASVVMGRSARERDVARAPLPAAAIVSLSWRLLVHSLAPAAVGAILAFMTRQLGDYYLMLAVTLVGLVLLYPRFDQWVTWSRPLPEAE